MLSKINRIKDKKKFPAILNRGVKFFCPFFLLLVEPPIRTTGLQAPTERTNGNFPERSSTYIEFGFITSKKVGGAVKRNHIRRLLSEIITQEIPLLRPNTRAIIIAHNRATDLTFDELKKEVKTVLTKANLY